MRLAHRAILLKVDALIVDATPEALAGDIAEGAAAALAFSGTFELFPLLPCRPSKRIPQFQAAPTPPSPPAANDPPCRNSAILPILKSHKSWFRQRSPKNPGHTRPIGASWPALTNCAFDCNICSIPSTVCSLAPIESAAGIFGSQTGRLQRHIPPSHVVLYSVFTFPVLPEGMIYTPCQKWFSLAYIRAVAAHAGYLVDEPQIDRSSIDGVVRANFGRAPRIELQAKATSQDILRGEPLGLSLANRKLHGFVTSCHDPPHPDRCSYASRTGIVAVPNKQ